MECLIDNIWINDEECEYTGRFNNTTSLLSNGELVTFGGCDFTPKMTKFEAEKIELDLKNNTFTLHKLNTSPPTPPLRGKHTVFQNNEYLFIFGGMGNAGYMNDIWRCKFTDKENQHVTWEQISTHNSSPPPLHGLTSVLFEENDGHQFVYCFGGYTSSSTFISDIFRFDLQEMSWCNMSDLPSSDIIIASNDNDDNNVNINYNNNINNNDAVCDDNNGDGKTSKKSKIWRKLKRKVRSSPQNDNKQRHNNNNNYNGEKTPKGRIHHSAVNWNGQMWIFGGKSTHNEIYSDLWSWNPSSNHWTYCSSAPIALFGHTCEVIACSASLSSFSSSLCFIGGKNTQSANSSLLIFRFIDQSWHIFPLFYSSPPPPSPLSIDVNHDNENNNNNLNQSNDNEDDWHHYQIVKMERIFHSSVKLSSTKNGCNILLIGGQNFIGDDITSSSISAVSILKLRFDDSFKSQSSFVELADEILLHIFQYIHDPFDICAIAITCSSFYRLIKDKRSRIIHSSFTSLFNIAAYPSDRPSFFHQHRKFQSDYRGGGGGKNEEYYQPKFVPFTLDLVNRLNVRGLKDESQIKFTSSERMVKIHLGGVNGYGKTTFGYTYQQGFYTATYYLPTVFDTFEENIAGIEYIFFDTAGGEEYWRLRELGFPLTSVFALFVSPSSAYSLSDIEHPWVPRIRAICPDTPLVLIISQEDLYDKSDKMVEKNMDDITKVATRVNASAILVISSIRDIRSVFFAVSMLKLIGADYEGFVPIWKNEQLNKGQSSHCSIQ